MSGTESNVYEFTTGRTIETPRNTGQDYTMYGSGDGGDGMLEARVKHLEDDVSELKADMKVVRSDLAELKGKVGMLPGWGGLVAVTGFIVTAVGLMIRFMPPAGTP